ncbi:hypothetical protein LXL04_023041 [Taraxacum kok-saghyz]
MTIAVKWYNWVLAVSSALSTCSCSLAMATIFVQIYTCEYFVLHADFLASIDGVHKSEEMRREGVEFMGILILLICRRIAIPPSRSKVKPTLRALRNQCSRLTEPSRNELMLLARESEEAEDRISLRIEFHSEELRTNCASLSVFWLANGRLSLRLNLRSAAPLPIEHWRHLHQL